MLQQPKTQFGFTLLELLVTIALVAILASYAIPTFRSTVQNNQLRTCANKMVSAVQFAKSEAVNTRRNVVIDLRSIGSAQPIFHVGLDPDSDTIVDPANAADLLQTFRCEGSGLTMSTATNLDYFSFGTTGFRSDGQGIINFLTCNEMDNGRTLSVSVGGAISTAEAAGGSCP